MVNVTFIGNRRSSDVVDMDSTIREAMQAHNLPWENKTVTISGTELRPEELNMTFRELGFLGSCTIVSMDRKTNA